jgi:hypothetical protein
VAPAEEGVGERARHADRGHREEDVAAERPVQAEEEQRADDGHEIGERAEDAEDSAVGVVGAEGLRGVLERGGEDDR